MVRSPAGSGLGPGAWLALGLGACAVGGILNPTQFFHSYLLAFMIWLALGLGSLALLMLHHLTGGVWGYVIRRVLEASTRTLPLMAVLYLPLVLGLIQHYLWAPQGRSTITPPGKLTLASLSFSCAPASILPCG